jgi:hypothetical protein
LHGDRASLKLVKLDEVYAKFTYLGKEAYLKKTEKSSLDAPHLSDQCLKDTSKQELFEAGVDYFHQILIRVFAAIMYHFYWIS